MCDPSVFLWLQYIRYHTENYEPTVTTTLSENRIMTAAEVESIGSTKPVIIAFPLEVKHANECRLSCEFQEETVEELRSTTPVLTVVDEHSVDGDSGCCTAEPEDVMLWKEELRNAYSSEDECEEFTQQVGAKGLVGFL